MHQNILTQNQIELLPLVSRFTRQYYLVGGTAIALQLGHRRSIDFDLFSSAIVDKKHVKHTLTKSGFEWQLIFEDGDQLHVSIHGVKVTFYEFPYQIPHELSFDKTITMPSLLTLAAMKAFALGGRGKWKDYVDIYFLLKYHFSLREISAEAERLFGGRYNAKLLRQQLIYYKDVNYSEEIEYIGEPVANETIEHFLTEVATEKI